MKKGRQAKIVGIWIVAILTLASAVVADTQSVKDGVNEEGACSMQPPAIEWSKTYGGDDFDHFMGAFETNDGNYLAFGSRKIDDLYYKWAMKVDADGNEIWNTTILPSESEESWAYSGYQTDDGGFFVVGYVSILDIEHVHTRSSFIWKLDWEGTTEWFRQDYQGTHEGTPYTSNFLTSIEDGDGYILTGAAALLQGDLLDTEPMLSKVDSEGNVVWTEIYKVGEEYMTTYGDCAIALCRTNDGGFLLTGDAELEEGNIDFLMLKIDSDRNLEWFKTYGGDGTDEHGFSKKCFQTADNGYITCGWSDTYGAGRSDLWIVKTDANGNMEWNETYGSSKRDVCWCMDSTNDGGYIFAMVYNYVGFQTSYIWLIKTDSNGIAQWKQTIGSSNEYRLAHYVGKTSDGGYIVAGRTGYWDASSSDGLLVKIAPDKTMVTPEMEVQKPKTGRLYLFDILGLPFPFTPNALVLGDLTFTVTASDASGIEKVEFFIDDKVVGEVTETPYTFEWTEAEKGTYTLKIRAYNNYGGIVQETVTIQKVW